MPSLQAEHFVNRAILSLLLNQPFIKNLLFVCERVLVPRFVHEKNKLNSVVYICSQASDVKQIAFFVISKLGSDKNPAFCPH